MAEKQKTVEAMKTSGVKKPEKKVDPHAIPPNNKLPFIAGGLIIFAIFWLVYQINPAGMVRSETADEKKERLQAERDEEMKKKANKKTH